MGILDEAIRQHLDLKRRHGADDSEVKQLEDEAFGLPTRPGEPDFPESDQHSVVPAEGEAESPASSDQLEDAPEAEAPKGDEPVEASTAATEAPPAPEPPAPEEPASAEEPVLASDPPPAPAEPDAAEEPTQFFDQEISEPPSEEAPVAEAPPSGEMPAADAPPSEEFPVAEQPPSEEHPIAAMETEEHPMDELLADEEEAELDEQEEAAAPAPITDEQSLTEPLSGEDEIAEEAEPAEGDVLEETPEFLRDQPEDDELWFEQGEPKDFDFD